MAIFLGVHKFPAGEESRDKSNKNWENYKKSAESMGLKPLKVLISFESGVAYCQTEAETVEQVKKAHNNAQVPFEEVIEVETLD